MKFGLKIKNNVQYSKAWKVMLQHCLNNKATMQAILHIPTTMQCYIFLIIAEIRADNAIPT